MREPDAVATLPDDVPVLTKERARDEDDPSMWRDDVVETEDDHSVPPDLLELHDALELKEAGLL